MNAPSPAPGQLLAALQQAADDAEQALVVLDGSQHIVLVNVGALRLLGCDDETRALGQPWAHFIAPGARAAQAQWLQALVAPDAPASCQRQSSVGLRADGREFTLDLSACRLAGTGRGDSPAPGPLFAVHLHDAGADARRLRDGGMPGDPLRSILDLAPTAIWIAEGDHIAFANRACAALFGAPDHRVLLGRSIYSLLMPESHAPVRLGVSQALAGQDELPVVNERIARLDGSVREVEIAMAPMPDHGRTTLQMVISDTTERNRFDRARERSRRELRQLTAGLVEAREEERRRIARELHDELGQRLTALKLELADLGATAAAAPADRRATLLAMVDDTIAEVRRIATELRPAVLDDLGLNAAIEGLAGDVARRVGLSVQLSLPPGDPPVAEATAIALYRMVQEALTNIARHAQATEAHIALLCDAHSVTLTVQDNGRGFAAPPRGRRGSHGLVGLRERCHMLGGQIEVGNADGGGARIRVRLPLGELPAEAAEPAEPAAGDLADAAPARTRAPFPDADDETRPADLAS